MASILMSATALDTLSVRPSVQAALGEARAALERLYGDRLVKVILYGSHARGEAHQESDVDVLVVLRGEVCVHDEIKRTNSLVSDLLLKYREFLTVQPFAEVIFKDTTHPLMVHVHTEGIEV